MPTFSRCAHIRNPTVYACYAGLPGEGNYTDVTFQWERCTSVPFSKKHNRKWISQLQPSRLVLTFWGHKAVGSWNEVRKGKRRERRLLSLESQLRFSSRIPVLNEVKLCFKNQRDKLEKEFIGNFVYGLTGAWNLSISLSLLLRFLAEFHFLYILVRLRSHGVFKVTQTGIVPGAKQ